MTRKEAFINASIAIACALIKTRGIKSSEEFRTYEPNPDDDFPTYIEAVSAAETLLEAMEERWYSTLSASESDDPEDMTLFGDGVRPYDREEYACYHKPK